MCTNRGLWWKKLTMTKAHYERELIMAITSFIVKVHGAHPFKKYYHTLSCWQKWHTWQWNHNSSLWNIHFKIFFVAVWSGFVARKNFNFKEKNRYKSETFSGDLFRNVIVAGAPSFSITALSITTLSVMTEQKWQWVEKHSL